MNKNKTALNMMEIPNSSPDGALPDWVMLLPARMVQGRDGRWWRNDRPEEILSYFAGLGRDLPIDIEHSTERKAPLGDPAPAIGWIDRMENRNGEIWGHALWNDAGKKTVGGREYRYLSPVILFTEADNTIVGITSVGATNQPNLTLPALNNENRGLTPKENSMWKNVLSALGLAETSTEADAVTAISRLKGDVSAAANRAENPSLEKFVPRADYDAALAKASNAEQKLSEIKTSQLETAINSAIETALKDGKITPATADYHRAQCRQDGGLDRFAAYCAAAPSIGGDSGLDGKKPEGEQKALNAEEKRIADMFGNSAEDLAKYGK